jgi:hypothetical protein
MYQVMSKRWRMDLTRGQKPEVRGQRPEDGTSESRRSEGEKIRGPDAKGWKLKEAGLKPWPTCPFFEPTM